MVDDNGNENDRVSAPSRIAPFQLLNVLTIEKSKSPQGLFYVAISYNGKRLMALLVINATHNFVVQKKSQDLGLNSDAQLVCGMTVETLKVSGLENDVEHLAFDCLGSIKCDNKSFKKVLQ